MATAVDLGSPGRDDQYGAGLTDAFRAVEAGRPEDRRQAAAHTYRSCTRERMACFESSPHSSLLAGHDFFRKRGPALGILLDALLMAAERPPVGALLLNKLLKSIEPFGWWRLPMCGDGDLSRHRRTSPRRWRRSFRPARSRPHRAGHSFQGCFSRLRQRASATGLAVACPAANVIPSRTILIWGVPKSQHEGCLQARRFLINSSFVCACLVRAGMWALGSGSKAFVNVCRREATKARRQKPFSDQRRGDENMSGRVPLRARSIALTSMAALALAGSVAVADDVKVPSDPVAKAAFDVLDKSCAALSRGRPPGQARQAGQEFRLRSGSRQACRRSELRASGQSVRLAGLQADSRPGNALRRHAGGFFQLQPHPRGMKALEAWIKSVGGSTGAACDPSKFISNADMIGYMAKDLDIQPRARVAGTRYLTLTNLKNACVSDADLNLYRMGAVSSSTASAAPPTWSSLRPSIRTRPFFASTSTIWAGTPTIGIPCSPSIPTTCSRTSTRPESSGKRPARRCPTSAPTGSPTTHRVRRSNNALLKLGDTFQAARPERRRRHRRRHQKGAGRARRLSEIGRERKQPADRAPQIAQRLFLDLV